MSRMDSAPNGKENITNDPRRSGQVTRYHTWPRLREQSVAEHSWQVQRILLAIWPEAPLHMLVHALVHDIGEVATGDLPFPTKMKNPGLKKIMDDAEHSAHLSMCLRWGLPPPRFLLPDGEGAIFKLADYIEMWEWALDEIAFGNSLAVPVRERCYQQMMAIVPNLIPDIQVHAMRYINRRIMNNGTHEVFENSVGYRSGNIDQEGENISG